MVVGDRLGKFLGYFLVLILSCSSTDSSSVRGRRELFSRVSLEKDFLGRFPRKRLRDKSAPSRYVLLRVAGPVRRVKMIQDSS